MNIKRFFTLLWFVLPLSITDVNAVTLNSQDWVVRDNTAYQASATLVTTDEGLRLNGGSWTNGRQNSQGEYDGNGVESKTHYNFMGSTSYLTFKVHGAGQYGGWWAKPYYVPMIHMNSHHSFASGLLIPDDEWIYASYKVETDGQWQVILATGNYDYLGGIRVHETSGQLTAEQIENMNSAPFLVTFGDNYAGTSAYLVIATAEVNEANPTNNTNNTPVACDVTHQDLCKTIESCTMVNGYWNTDWCGTNPQENPDHFPTYCTQGYSSFCQPEVVQNACKTASLDVSLKMYLPYVKYTPLFQDSVYLWIESQYMPEKTSGIYFNITDFGVLSAAELPADNCSLASLTASLGLQIPDLRYVTFPNIEKNLQIESQIEPANNGQYLLKVLDVQGLE